MESFLIVMEIIALGCLAALSIYLISVLVRLRSILTEVEKDIKELSVHAIPVFENLEAITEKIKNVTESINDQVDMVRHSISSIKEIADNIVNFERRIQESIEEPVLETVSVFASFFKGIRTFIDRMRS